MSGWVSSEEQDILESWFARTALPRTPTHIGLFTTLPSDDGVGGVEPSTGGYARVAFAANDTNWGSSVAGNPSTIQNLVAVTFAQATASLGTIKGWGYFTALTSGTLLYFAALTEDKTILENQTPEFAAGQLIAKLGDPSDTY